MPPLQRELTVLMRDHTLYILLTAVALLLVVTACNTTSGGYQGRFTEGRDDFGYYLAIGYEQLASYEEHLDDDKEAAGRFMTKARQARTAPFPALDPVPDDAGLPAADQDRLARSHDILQDALSHFQTYDGNGRYLAEAQVNFDCWRERLIDEMAAEHGSEDDRALRNQRTESCRAMFSDAVKALQIPGHFRFSVFFDSGDALLNEQAVETVRKASEHFVDDALWRLRLVGRSDPSGSYEDNVILSMRRAIAVRNALAQNGVDPDRIAIDAVGATDSASAADPAKARRVDIMIAPVYIGFDRNGPDIHEIVPHFFGETGD